MLSKPEELKSRILNQHNKVTIETEFYLLAKELGCLGDIIGRDYEFIFKDGKIIGMRQLPMKISSFISLMNEMERDHKNQEKAMKKRKR